MLSTIFGFVPLHLTQVIYKCLDTLHMKELRLEVWDFTFGKDDLKADNLSVLIKYYIYLLPKNEKEFLTEIKLRWLTDKINEHIYQTKYKDKWEYFENIQNEIRTIGGDSF